MSAYLQNFARGILVIGLLTIGGLVAYGKLAFATPAGCDPRVLNAMHAVAGARVALAKAVADELYAQPDSVLALTCFNKSASMAAQAAGNVFSGDFRSQLAPVVDDAMAATLRGNFAFSVGSQTGQVDYITDNAIRMDTTTPMNKPMTFNCDAPGRLWNTVNSQGVLDNIPNPTFQDMLNAPSGAVPGADPNKPPPPGYTNSMDKSRFAFDRLKEAHGQLPQRVPMPSCRCNKPLDVMYCKGAMTPPAGWTVAQFCQ